jgi:glycosyl transferase, family 25
MRVEPHAQEAKMLGAEGNVRILVINLARRPDRLAQMTALLGGFGLGFVRVDAVDAGAVSLEALRSQFADSAPLGPLSAGDMCCSQSHRLAWRLLAGLDCEWGVVLEDDVLLAADFAAVLADAAAIPEQVDLVKLERCTYSHRALLDAPVSGPAGHALQHLRSRHICAAGYMLRRRRAADAVQLTQRLAVPVDHFLFNPNLPGCGRAIAPHQLNPAVVEQEATPDGKNANSDIKAWRRKVRPSGMGLWRRELMRVGFSLGMLPSHAAHLLAGARFGDVDFGPATVYSSP